MNTSFFGEMLNSITERGRALLDRTRDRRGEPGARSESLAELCEEELGGMVRVFSGSRIPNSSSMPTVKSVEASKTSLARGMSSMAT